MRLNDSSNSSAILAILLLHNNDVTLMWAMAWRQLPAPAVTIRQGYGKVLMSCGLCL